MTGPQPPNTQNDAELPSVTELMVEIRKYWSTASGEPELKEFAEYVQKLIAAHLQAAIRNAEIQGRMDEVHYVRQYLNIDVNHPANKLYLAKRLYDLQDLKQEGKNT